MILAYINSRIHAIQADIKGVNGTLNARIDAVMIRIDAVIIRIDGVDRRIDGLERRIDELRDTWKGDLRRVEEILDARLKHLEADA